MITLINAMIAQILIQALSVGCCGINGIIGVIIVLIGGII